MTRYLLDTTVLIAHPRGDPDVTAGLLQLLARGNHLCVTCVNVAEVERGMRRNERRSVQNLLGKLTFLVTTREAARRAGEYQRTLQVAGVTIHTPHALIAGTARAHGAVVISDNVADFPMPDVTVVAPAALFPAQP